uniref:Uncharacterized protein n=1 Tax=Anguilla anguilla TaxID=7936 RepID=A0A0E9QMQ1_ANGAN
MVINQDIDKQRQLTVLSWGKDLHPYQPFSDEIRHPSFRGYLFITF